MLISSHSIFVSPPGPSRERAFQVEGNSRGESKDARTVPLTEVYGAASGVGSAVDVNDQISPVSLSSSWRSVVDTVTIS